MVKALYRGQIYYADLSDSGGLHCQNGQRPVIVVSNNIGNEHSPLVTVVPITTRVKKRLPTHFDIVLPGVFGTVLCEHVQTIGKEYIGDYASALTRHYVKQLDTCLTKVFNLDGSVGAVLPPEADEVVEKQIKAVEEARRKYFHEVKVLSRITGADFDDECKDIVRREVPTETVNDSISSVPSSVGVGKRTYVKRTEEEIEDFIFRMEMPFPDYEAIAKDFKFSSVAAARLFYSRHKKKETING